MNSIFVIVVICGLFAFSGVYGVAVFFFLRFQSELSRLCGSRKEFSYLNDKIGGINRRHGILLLWDDSVIEAIGGAGEINFLRKRAILMFWLAVIAPIVVFLLLIATVVLVR